MAAVDPQGGAKYWQQNGQGPFDTLARTGIDPGAQKWWVPSPAQGSPDFTLAGLIGSAPTPPTPPTSTFPALTVAG